MLLYHAHRWVRGRVVLGNTFDYPCSLSPEGFPPTIQVHQQAKCPMYHKRAALSLNDLRARGNVCYPNPRRQNIRGISETCL